MIAFSNALNVYTDASLTKINGTTSTCAGYVAVYHGKILDTGYRILYNTTNNYGEAYAVYMGVQCLLKYAHMDTFLNLFSDSKITVDGLTSWIGGWVKNQDKYGNMYSSAGSKVANQELLSAIIGLIRDSQTHMQIFHILGHKDPNKYGDILKSKDMFKRENGVLLSDEIIREICSYNCFVDNMTRDALLNAAKRVNLAAFASPEIAARRKVDQKMVNEYLDLLKD